tara:strand:+ start:133 stop:351 length:219 start_codon:yes stop_codon:yes gene_type:complete
MRSDKKTEDTKKPRTGVELPFRGIQADDASADLYRFQYLAEILIVTLGMPTLTFKVYGFAKFEVDVFNVFIT